ncbi:Putative glycogen debranching enzyme [Acidilobus saccharovorans 345-15]|uniref:Putative glycogen debranching enzyme n=2 Tax=Acidilobus TaxID=105850 RepID=D9Q2E1_ACIS3|nr:Putative glycogen debranching enzyme [Acidilobus saccharovorans 345-15]
MYMSVRPRLGKDRYGEPDLIFSYPWPEVAAGKHIYLVSEFTSYFPGRVELKRKGNRGVARVPVREGLYHYAFVDSLYRVYTDYENPRAAEVDLGLNMGRVMASVAEAGLKEIRDAISEGGLHGNLILHDERWPGYLSGYGGITAVRVFTVREEVDSVTLLALVEGSWKPFEAELALRDSYRDYYEARVPGRVEAYYFLLSVDGKKLPFGFDGLGSREPWMAESGYYSDTIPWYLGTSYYLVFPDSFAGYREDFVKLKTRPRERIGGNLKGLAEKLSYIKSVGFEAIYLTPIYVSNSYHRYDVIDQHRVDPSLGGEEALEDLVKESHRLGIKVVLDLVVHHTSPCSKEFSDALKGWKSSVYWNWYRFLVDSKDEVAHDAELLERYVDSGCRSFPEELRSKDPFYETFAKLWGMPKLNHQNRAVLDELCRVVSDWVARGIDGFRIDVAHGLPDDAMKYLYECIVNRRSESPVIMEIMGELSAFPMGIISNSAMNYEARGPILSFFRGEMTAFELSEKLNRQYLRLPLHVANALYNLLGSHDTPRVMDILGSKDLVARALVLTALMYGSFSAYYGDEVGLRGGKDPDNRLPMPWDESLWDKDLLDLVRKLIALRKASKALRYGYFKASPLGSDAIYVERTYGGETIMGYVTRRAVELSSLVECGEILLEGGLRNNYLDGFVLCRAK